MKKLLFACLALIIANIHLTGIASPRFTKRFTRDEKIEALSRVWSEIKYNFAFIDEIDFDMDSLYRATLPRVIASKNDVEFMNELRHFMVRFEDGHTNVGYPSYNWSWFYDFAPVRFEEINGRYWLGYLSEDSGLDSLALGAELVEIDGEPTKSYVHKNYYPLITGSTDRVKADIATSNYIGTGLIGSRFRGKLRLSNGCEVNFSMRCNEMQRNRRNPNRTLREWEWTDWRRYNANKNIACSALAEGRIARLDIIEFDEDDIPQLETMLDSLRERAKGLVIDLRYCRGGSSLVGNVLLSRIINADSVCINKAMTRRNIGYGRAQGNWQPQYEDYYLDRAFDTLPCETLHIDSSKLLRMPIVILTGKRTVSAAETFLIQLYELPGRPKIIGQRTRRTTGSPLIIDLPHDAWVRICTLKHLYPISGKPFGKEGIIPDEEIGLTVEDFLNGRDRVMERAISIIETGN